MTSAAIVLKNIEIASPCTAPWDKMKGNEQVRHCNDCNKNVYNLSAMPEREAAALIQGNTTGELCVRIHRRADGTVMTSDCSTSTRALTRRTLRKVPLAAGGALLALSAAYCVADPGKKIVPLQPLSFVEPPPVVTAGAVMVTASEPADTYPHSTLPPQRKLEPGEIKAEKIQPLTGEIAVEQPVFQGRKRSK